MGHRSVERSALAAKIAKTWLNTPYQHQASIKHIGCDCLGLLRGIWRELIGVEPETMPAYPANWTIGSDKNMLLDMMRRNFTQKLETQSMMAGDILLFKYRHNLPASHIAIMLHQDKFIHAYIGRGVIVSQYSKWWQRHLVHHFSW